ncbi:M36 family metallopeptidase [Oryzibacter oryziterrae]|uniref:M36 family metallopeptidase n=1 Tax=Oryzibacter oryziterrae TaxID=2766474 RepID=UPI001F01E3A6|nr:M36 family metallopeptidase [Oryzibacter oryziterrae]
MSKYLARRLISASVAMLSVLTVGTHFAAAAGTTAEASAALSRLAAGKTGTLSVEWSKSGTDIKRLAGGPKLSTVDVAASAEHFLKDGKAIFGLEGFTLGAPKSRRGLGSTHLTFRKQYQGLPVFNVVIDVHVKSSGELTLVTSNSRSLKTQKAPVSTVPALTSAKAGEVASAELARTVLHDKAGAPIAAKVPTAGARELGFFETDAGDILAWRVSFGSVELIVDAKTGAVLAKRVLVQSVSANGTGKAFDPNPVYTLNNSSLRDNGDKNFAALSPAYKSVKLPSIKKTVSGGKTSYSLSGPYVRMMDISATNVPNSCMNGNAEVRQGPPVQSGSAFNYNRSQAGFEHAMVYFTIDRSERYIKSLGFPDLWNKPIRIDAHGITDDNSFYCPDPTGAGYIVYGNGGVDDAEDADVVLHEYGHALQDAASDGKYSGGGETGAMGEGFGDYWAYSTYHTGKWGDCFADWDGQGKCLRHLNTNKVYPDDIRNEVHADGEIWSRGLRDLFKKLGKTKADTIILDSHYFVPDQPQFADGLAALVAADEEAYGGANKVAICTVFAARGISDTSCD